MPKSQYDQNYIEFMERSEEEVFLAIMDKLGVKVIQPSYEINHSDRSWACDIDRSGLSSNSA